MGIEKRLIEDANLTRGMQLATPERITKVIRDVLKGEVGARVKVYEQTCMRCGACAKACPYGAPVLDEIAHKMHKCDACADRLAQGLLPICVEACPQRAIEFGEVSELRKKYGNNADIAPLPSSSVTQPSLVIRPPLHMGKQG